MFKLAVIIGYSGSTVKNLAEAAEALQREGYEIELKAATPKSQIDWERFFAFAEDADVLFIYATSSYEHQETMLEANRERPIVCLGEGMAKSTVSLSEVALAEKYYKYGGLQNLKNLILYLGKLAGGPFSPEAPEEIPWYGIYSPRSPAREQGGSPPLLRSSAAGLPLAKRVRVGLLFYRSQWQNGDTALVDMLIEKFEAEGIGVLPIFSYSMGDRRLEIPGNEEVLPLFRGIDILINLQSFFIVSKVIGKDLEQGKGPLAELNVPILQGVKEYYQTQAQWRADPRGIGPIAQVMSVAQPEFDGTIEPILLGTKGEVEEPRVSGSYQILLPIEDRVDFLVQRAKGWLKLKDTKPENRKVTFLLHNAPCKSVEATVGRGAGLDTLESVVRIMNQMKEAGYRVENIPQSGKELIELILERKALSEFRWTTAEEIVRKGGVLEFVDPEDYRAWFDRLPHAARKKVLSSWGEPPGEAMVCDGKIMVTGLRFGNINIVVQPKRGCAGSKCDGQVCKVLHDPSLPPPHHWLATYRWIEQHSDAVVHVGTHGYLEFLPGKGVGLAAEDFPEISIADRPHLYIYTVANPSEGIIAKRRSYATLVDHLGPVMSPSRLYDELEQLEELLGQYENARDLGEDTRLGVLQDQIAELAERINLFEDREYENFEAFLNYLHSQLTLFRETQIRDGLHILSEAPQRDGLVDMLVSILRFDGQVPSIRRKLLEVQGYDYEEALSNPACGTLLEESTRLATELMKIAITEAKRDRGFRISDFRLKNAKEIGDYIIRHPSLVTRLMDVRNPEQVEGLLQVVNYGLNLIPRIEAVEREIPQLLKGLDGQFIEPGASGSVTKGRIEVLPTGRNFYGVDPGRVPTQAAVKVGEELAEKLLARFLDEEGRYPESVGMVLWSIDIFRADGEEVAQILYLMGARPKWDSNGRVRGIEVIPLKDLKRPRIDVTVRLSGIFRDTLPHIYELIDEAVGQIAGLDEPEEMNYIRKHTRASKEKGLSERESTYRIFASPPGTYGTGVNYAIEASAWKDEADLRDVYVDWGGYAYGKGAFGQAAHKAFALNLQKVEISYNKLESDEHDSLDCCCYFAYQGGLTAAVKSLSGREVKTYWGDTRNPGHADVRDMKTEIERIVRTRLLNPKWLEGKKRHGYKGAGDISSRVLHTFGWDATSGVVPDWIYDQIHQRIVKGLRHWFMESNLYALEEIARRLLEAHQRGMWQTEEETLEELRSIYLELEGLLEDEERRGDFQGGDVKVLAKQDVQEWKEKVKHIEGWKEVIR
ncbi:MAG TPA: cobaltochelatase subunit CobN [Candidatus Latescibacteria bacterium]|nr:cobaltochelatase subunit CobN [Candidatus Latescibacterota bacterium]